MSKAFLRESDADESPDLPAPFSSLPPGVKNYLTAAGARRLTEELHQLSEIVRPALAGRHDDPEAKRELRQLDQRLRYLRESLRTAEVVTPGGAADGVVRFGSRVTVRDAGGTESAYAIVGVDEADPAAGAISWRSPLARALLNSRAGDRVVFQAPAGPRELQLVQVEPA